MPSTDIYISTDIETNGPHIGKNSILSLASAAFSNDKKLIDTFSINLENLPDGEVNEETMTWWQTYPDAYQATRINLFPASIGMQNYIQWLKQFTGRLVFVAAPVAFDFSFVAYYLKRFAGENPFGFNAIDLRSLVMGIRKTPFAKSSMNYWPKRWFEGYKHTHIALDDAIEQGVAFCNMLKENNVG